MTAPALALDETGRASLDGVWEFFPGAESLADLEGRSGDGIAVPALWEAQGWVELDGPAWYRRTFALADVRGWWTLRFGAVMDMAQVWLNGVFLGHNDSPFVPFTVDPTDILELGENVLAVRVDDPRVDDAEHIRLMHGKQGWANHVFPSRPSLYMTYGGIWQPVELRRHGPVVIRSTFVNSDPEALSVTVTLENRSDVSVTAELGVNAVGKRRQGSLDLAPRSVSRHVAAFGRTAAARWRPSDPVLHDALVDVAAGDGLSDSARVRFGLRTIRVEGTRLLLEGEPYRMKSALVQGFRADVLYAEGSRAQIEEEVRAAQAMGFNTLRLHIKAFDPAYLDVCDELGMLLHCDIPIAEPIAHEELGSPEESLVGRRAVDAVRRQIERDRNHPSVVLWSVMNELCLDRLEARDWDGYERFARALVAAAKEVDPTRPVIENDWVEPDPGRVFAGDVLTAHWYGRLHADYLAELEASCRRWMTLDRPLVVTEFGDWGLPDMPHVDDAPFWDPREIYAAGLASTLWPSTIERFVTETQRYQGLSDRLQAEVFRRHDHIGGYCLTELTDVPHELNGLLDLHRRPKPIAAAEMTVVNQTILPMLHLRSLVVHVDEMITAPFVIANDGPALAACDVDIRFGNTTWPLPVARLLELDTSEMQGRDVISRFDELAWAAHIDEVAAFTVTTAGDVTLLAPEVPGRHDLVVRLRSHGTLLAENRYPVHVVRTPSAAGVTVQSPHVSDELRTAFAAVGATVGRTGPLVVGEGDLEAHAGTVADRLGRGERALVLAQPAELARFYPVDIELEAVATKWGSSVFHFTTDHGALPSLPRRNVLVAEDSTVQARSVVAAVGGVPFPDEPVVIAYKPVPGALTGTVVGAQRVGAGKLLFCQYRLQGGAAAGDAAATSILADLLSWAAERHHTVKREATVDGSGGVRATRYWRDDAPGS